MPRDYQRPFWNYFENGGKRGVAIWHRRAGKDDVCLHLAACSMVDHPAAYWHMLPEASQARKAVWNAVNPHTGVRRIDEAFPLELRANTQEHEMFIRFKNGSTWQVIGSDNYNSLVGSPPYGVVFSEWALAKPGAWAYLRPILAENGGWAAFITTSRGNNHAKNTYDLGMDSPEWFAEKLRADQTSVFSREQLENELKEYISDYGTDEGTALFEQEYMCSFDSAVFGSYYGKFLKKVTDENRITSVPYDPAVKVETWWDLGIGDAMSIIFTQSVANEIRVIDYVESEGEGLPYYAKLLQDKGYIYGKHHAPHDIEVRELGSGKSRKETALALGIRFETVPRLSVDDGIQAARNILTFCWFDKTNTKDLVTALKEYHKEFDEKRKVFKNTPCHDWSSHAADAFRYLAVGHKKAKTPVKQRPQPQQSSWMGM